MARKRARRDAVSSCKRGDTASGPLAVGPSGWGGGRRHALSGSLRVVCATLPLAFLAWLARRRNAAREISWTGS